MSDDFVVLLVVFAVSVTVNVGLAMTLFRTNKRLRRLEHRPQGQLDDLQGRVDAALDGVATRLDELSSAQDFMNRVVVERLDKLNRAALQKGASPPDPS